MTIPVDSIISVSPNFNTDSIPGFGTVVVEIYQVGFASSADTVTFTGSTLGTGIAESSMENINIYPNPTTTAINISTISSTNFILKIADESGRLLSSSSHSEKNTKVSFNDLPAGYYFLNFSFENGITRTRKILKMK